MLNPDTWKIVTSLIFSDKHLPGLSTEASVFHLKFAMLKANQQYEETHEEETSAAGFQQQMPDVDHFIKGRKNGTTVRAII